MWVPLYVAFDTVVQKGRPLLLLVSSANIHTVDLFFDDHSTRSMSTWLQKENIRLRNMLKQSRISMENKTGNDSSLVRINDTLWKQQYDFVAATIINSTYDKRNNYFTLNVGKAQGVERGRSGDAADGAEQQGRPLPATQQLT